MGLLAVTVIGADQPGIIARTTAILADLGGNLEDTTMTILRGHFAMVLLVATEVRAADAERALAPLSDDGTLLVSVRDVPAGTGSPSGGTPYVLSLHGADRAGIVSAVTAVLAGVGANITDLSTRLAETLYVLVAEVDLPQSVDVDALSTKLRAVAGTLGVEASLRPVDPDVL